MTNNSKASQQLPSRKKFISQLRYHAYQNAFSLRVATWQGYTTVLLPTNQNHRITWLALAHNSLLPDQISFDSKGSDYAYIDASSYNLVLGQWQHLMATSCHDPNELIKTQIPPQDQRIFQGAYCGLQWLETGDLLAIRRHQARYQLICFDQPATTGLQSFNILYQSIHPLSNLGASDRGNVVVFLERLGVPDQSITAQVVLLKRPQQAEPWRRILPNPTTLDEQVSLGDPQIFDGEGKLGYMLATPNHSSFVIQSLKTGELKQISLSDHDISEARRSAGHSWAALASNQIAFAKLTNGRHQLVTLDLDSEKQALVDCDQSYIDEVIAIPQLSSPLWTWGSHSRSRAFLWCSSQGPFLPSRDLEKRWYPIDDDDDDEMSYVRHLLQWRNQNSTIFGLYYHPKSAPNSAVPTILPIHGLEYGQVYDGFQPKAHYFCSRGFGVLFVNYRGSSGFGPQYQHQGVTRWNRSTDIILGLEQVIDRELSNGSAAIWGGRQGGQIALETCLAYPGRFQVLLMAFSRLSIPNKAGPKASPWRSIIEQLPPAIGYFYGSDDPEIDQSQVDLLYRQASELQHSCQIKAYDGESKSFDHIENYRDYYQTIDDILNQFLKR